MIILILILLVIAAGLATIILRSASSNKTYEMDSAEIFKVLRGKK